MAADFWAGYLSGAAGIIIGNPLDLIKTRLQAGPASTPATSPAAPANTGLSSYARGAAAPVLGYGALNALLFMTYNRALQCMGDDPSAPGSLAKVALAGVAGGLATFVVSAPTELVKCSVQVGAGEGSWAVAGRIWRSEGVRGLYRGGGITAVRDGFGYGVYYLAYELSKRALMERGDGQQPEWMSVLLCGGIAGVASWTSIFPLDVIKTRVQTQGLVQRDGATSPLLQQQARRLSTFQIARQAYQQEGPRVFVRGLGVCSVRAFFVNAIQFFVYEWTMHILMIPGAQQPATI